MRFLPFLFLLLLPSLGLADPDIPTEGPSFDCELASTKAEKAICADPYIAELDQHVSDVFRSLPTEVRQDLLDQQRVWLRQRDGCVADNEEREHRVRSCLLQIHEEQSVLLSRALENASDLVPISGFYGNVSEVYDATFGGQTVSRWEMRVLAKRPDGTYAIRVESRVGPTHHRCYINLMVKRTQSILEVTEVLSHGHEGPLGFLALSPENYSIDLLDLSDAPHCGNRAYATGMTYFLER